MGHRTAGDALIAEGDGAWPNSQGGAPTPATTLPGIAGEKAIRRLHKRQEKLREDAERPPRSLERWRILMDIVDEGRRIVDLVDHKARYAFVIMGVLNTGLILVLSRGRLIESLPPGLKPWLIGSLLIYAALSLLFVYYAVDCLRPRKMRDTGLQTDARNAAWSGRHAPLGLLYWETTAEYGLEAYQQAWSAAHMEQLNAELVLINHHLSRLIRSKYAALGRLYRGLALLVLLGALQLAVFAGFALLA